MGGVQVTDVPRVTVTPRTVDAQEVASIVSLVQLGRTPEAWERFQVASVGDGALARLGGVINAALAQPGGDVVTLPPPTGYVQMAIAYGDSSRHAIPYLAGGVVSVAFFLPAGTPVSVVPGHIKWGEYGGEPKLRVASIARTSSDPADMTIPAISRGGGKASHLAFVVGANEGYDEYTQTAVLSEHMTYYFNMRNLDYAGGNQPAAVEIIWPR